MLARHEDEVIIGPETVVDLGAPKRKGRLATWWDRMRNMSSADFDDAAEAMAERLIQRTKDLGDDITKIPDQWRKDIRLLSDPHERRMLTKALVHEGHLTSERRRSLQSILLWGGLALWTLVGLGVRILFPDAAPGYSSAFWFFLYSLATSIFLPTPFEILLGAAVANLGWFLAILIAATGKTAGAFLVLVLGQRVSEGLNFFLDLSPKIRYGFDWMTAMAAKYGAWALFVLFAIPFMSDTLPLVIFAILGMERKKFLAVMFAAIVVRSALYLLLF